METLREKLAAIQHEIWGHWMEYLFNVCTENEDGSYTIPSEKVRRWKHQISTHYSELSESEKFSDQKQADKVLFIINKHNKK